LHIRCERCSTVYELDPARLSPAGTPVQCTRCRHVFRAFPPGDGKAALPLGSEVNLPGPGDPGAGAPAAAGAPGAPEEPERTSLYPAPAPPPGRPAPASPAAIVPGRKVETTSAPAARPREGRSSMRLVVVVLVVLAIAAAAWMALRGG
jgi:predicted Zn finger-like uncharacterized protein